MRATGCSERALALALAVVASGCTTTSSSVRRGTPISSAQSPWVLEGREQRASLANDVLSMRERTRECTTIVTETPLTEVTTTRTTFPLGTLLGAVAGVGGGVLVIDGLIGLDETEAEMQARLVPPLASLIVGAVLAGVAIPMLSTGKPEVDTRSERERPLRPELKSARECRDAEGASRGPLAWSLEVGGVRRTGQTDASGRVDLADPIIALVREAAERPSGMAGLVRSSSIPYVARLGDAGPLTGALSTRRIPDAFFQEQAAKYEATLGGDLRNKWDNCKLIARTAREQFECIWSQ